MDVPELAAPAGWTKGGPGMEAPRVSTEASMSPTHALAIVDQAPNSFGSWYQFLPLPAGVRAGDEIVVQWWEMFSLTNGEMIFSITLRNSLGTVYQPHAFVAWEQSSGWRGAPGSSSFTKRDAVLTVPNGATEIEVFLGGGRFATIGTMLIDDLSMQHVPNDLKITNLRKTPQGWEITWQSKPGRSYAVQATPSLSPLDFRTIPGLEAVSASSETTTSAIDTRPGERRMAFYRIFEAR